MFDFLFSILDFDFSMFDFLFSILDFNFSVFDFLFSILDFNFSVFDFLLRTSGLGAGRIRVSAQISGVSIVKF